MWSAHFTVNVCIHCSSLNVEFFIMNGNYADYPLLSGDGIISGIPGSPPPPACGSAVHYPFYVNSSPKQAPREFI